MASSDGGSSDDEQQLLKQQLRKVEQKTDWDDDTYGYASESSPRPMLPN